MSDCYIVVLALQIPGLVNVDFADVRAIMANAGSSLMGIGTATGKSRVFFGIESILLIGSICCTITYVEGEYWFRRQVKEPCD